MIAATVVYKFVKITTGLISGTTYRRVYTVSIQKFEIAVLVSNQIE